MVEEQGQIKRLLTDLFFSQQLAVLATSRNGRPYSNLVSFAATPELDCLLFATTRATRKYANIARNAHASMLVDNRRNVPTDIHRAMAVSASGVVRETSKKSSANLLNIYLGKHPHLAEFVGSPSCAFFCMRVSTYYLVRKFQEVIEVHMVK